MPTPLQQFDNRQEMRDTPFEIFHYRDRHPGSVALHHHDFYEVYYFVNGSVDYLVEGKTCRLEPGDLQAHQPAVQLIAMF